MSGAELPDRVHHLAHRAEWEAAVGRGEPYVPSGFERDGFVHCSTAAQVAATADRWFPPDADLLLVTLDAPALGGALRFEPGSLGEAELFPHLYTPIDPQGPALLSVAPYPPG